MQFIYCFFILLFKSVISGWGSQMVKAVSSRQILVKVGQTRGAKLEIGHKLSC